MGRSLGFRALYPKYPILLSIRKSAQIRLGTRRFYVDVPWQAYALLLAYFSELNNGASFYRVKEKFLKYERETLIFDNKSLCKINLYKQPIGDNLRLIVNWNALLNYLEHVSLEYLKEIKYINKDNVGEVVRRLYETIWNNFFQLLNQLGTSKSPYDYLSPKDYMNYLKLMIDFRKLLRHTGDLEETENLIVKLMYIIKGLDYFLDQQKLIHIRFYTINLIMDIYHLNILIHRTISIPEAYMLLRNILELLTRLYICLARLKRENIISIREVNKAFLLSLQLPIRKKDLLNISKKMGLEDTLARLYSVCSEVIHRQPPLPFYSLLEFKFFKNFLKEYVEAVKRLVEIMIGIPIEIHEPDVNRSYVEKLRVEQKSIEIADDLLSRYSDKIKTFIKSIISIMNELDLRALKVLAFIFNITIPSWKKLKEGVFIEDDLFDVIRELELISIGLERVIIHYSINTLNSLRNQLAQWLKEKGIVRGSDELIRKTAFYILTTTLPEVLI